ncbi:GntR family transcriptional regulator [Streptomyces avermitilis]
MTKTEHLGAVPGRVLADLRQEIIAGRLRPGDRLVERERAERFGVSRAPVREAIRAWFGEGFVHFETPRRTVVRRLTPTDVTELCELREALEVYAAGLAASRATPQAPAEPAELLDQAATATHALSHVQANHRSTVRHLFGAAGNEGEL